MNRPHPPIQTPNPLVAASPGPGRQSGEGYAGPLRGVQYELPFSVLLPRRTEATNLLCPLTLSASHVALATLRMEPQFMVLGHTAGTAAALRYR